MARSLVILISIATLGVFVVARPKRRLDSFISHFEELDYGTETLASEHSRIKRETPGYNRFEGDPLRFSFGSHGRTFQLALTPHHAVFHPHVRFVDHQNKPFQYDTSELYSGHVVGDLKSKAAGTVVDGKFHGVIQTSEDRYHIEPASRYFKNPDFHSIVYKASNVEFDMDSCGASPEIKLWMDNMQNSAVKNSTAKQGSSHANMYAETPDRRKRALSDQDLECRIKIAGDHMFSEQVAREEGITVASDRTGVLSAVSRVLSRYVMNVNMIYSTTAFMTSGSSQPEGIVFQIQTVQVYLTAQETAGLNSELANQLIGVDRFLDVWSRSNYTDFCLAYMFTNRDFDNGVLGLAWVGSAGSSNGGICDRFTRYSDGISKTLNTGIVTTLNFNKQVAREVSYLTFAHELGHNMGSNHDPATTRCSPGAPSGNYIMYAHATSGTDPNNRLFSPCSIAAISSVVQAKAPSCFEPLSNGAICGNGILDIGTAEVCDCGNTMQCQANAQCCSETGCTLQSNKTCAPQQGPCCNSTTCHFHPVSANINCTEPNECREGLGSCNGTSAECILPPAVPNGVICGDGTATCNNGACTGSLCVAYNAVSCFCSGDADRCKVCCQPLGQNSSNACKPLATFSGNFTGIVTDQQAGAPCDNFQGFCDFFSFCRRLDDQGPIARLRSVFFSSETITNFIEWVQKYPWAVALIVVGIVIIMGLIVHFLSKNTKSTVEAKRKKAQETRQKDRDDIREMNNVRRR